jgi:L-histidine N-alpha-methyltransferase
MAALPGRPALSVEVYLGPDDLASTLREDARRGLTSHPKWLPPKWFYDERGSQLFEAITRLPEYYASRCERSILDERSGQIAELTLADTVVELGAGTSEKTRLLLDALWRSGTLRRFAALDVSEPTLRAAGGGLLASYPGLEVTAVVGDFERHLDRLPTDGRRLIAFLGGTIGNLEPPQRRRFLHQLSAGMKAGDCLLLGADLVKDPSRLQAAYEDAAGVTASFNRNVLHVLNRELGADFVPDRFDHVARWIPEAEWIEMHLRSGPEQRVLVPAIGVEAHFEAGEEMRTEISAKFRRSGVEAELADAGLDLAHWWTDPSGDFALSLSFVR